MTKQNKIFCLMDIGGTKTISLLIDENKKIIYRDNFPTWGYGKDVKSFLHQINGAIKRAIQQAGENLEIIGVGICIAAFVNFNDGVVKGAPNLPFKDFLPLKEILENKWGLPVLVENDANAAVVGEVKYGAAIGSEDAIYITVSTGIGAGLFLGNNIYRGAGGFAGEVGHMKVLGENRICGCGEKGCLESISSGTAVANIGKEVLGKEPNANKNIDAAIVFNEARKGNKDAVEIVNTALKNLGLSFANIVSLLNPQYIIVGGGMSKEGDAFIKEIKKYMEIYISTPAGIGVEVVKATLNPDSGIWGMYYLLNMALVSQEGY